MQQNLAWGQTPAVSVSVQHCVYVCIFSLEECNACHDHKDTPGTAADTESPAATEPLRERPVEEVAARLAQQDLEEQDILACRPATTAHAQEKQSTT